MPDSALSVVGQTDGVAVIASHYASLSQQRDVRERLVFVKMQPIGSVHLRPRGLDVCTLRGRITRVVRSGAAIRNVAIDPKQRA